MGFFSNILSALRLKKKPNSGKNIGKADAVQDKSGKKLGAYLDSGKSAEDKQSQSAQIKELRSAITSAEAKEREKLVKKEKANQGKGKSANSPKVPAKKAIVQTPKPKIPVAANPKLIRPTKPAAVSFSKPKKVAAEKSNLPVAVNPVGPIVTKPKSPTDTKPASLAAKPKKVNLRKPVSLGATKTKSSIALKKTTPKKITQKKIAAKKTIAKKTSAKKTAAKKSKPPATAQTKSDGKKKVKQKKKSKVPSVSKTKKTPGEKISPAKPKNPKEVAAEVQKIMNSIPDKKIRVETLDDSEEPSKEPLETEKKAKPDFDKTNEPIKAPEQEPQTKQIKEEIKEEESQPKIAEEEIKTEEQTPPEKQVSQTTNVVTNPKEEAKFLSKKFENAPESKRMQEFIREKAKGTINEEKLAELEQKMNNVMQRYNISENEIEQRLSGATTSNVLDSINKLVTIMELERETKSKEMQPEKIITAMKITEPLKTIEKVKGVATEIKKHRLVTDFDKIVVFIVKKGKAKFSEISKETGIPKNKVVECCKLLEKENQINVVYPAIGEPSAQVIDYTLWKANEKLNTSDEKNKKNEDKKNQDKKNQDKENGDKKNQDKENGDKKK